MKLQKVKLKVISDIDDSIIWSHVCYMSEDVYYRFLDTFRLTRQEVADYIAKWILDEFGIALTMTHQNDIYIMKELIKGKYKSLNPDLYIESVIDRQGLVRNYMTERMTMEVNRYVDLIDKCNS